MKPASDIKDRLRSVFATVLSMPTEEVEPELSPKTCPKWDSVNHIHLVNAIEEEFSVTLPFEDQMKMVSFKAAVETVMKLITG
jgi:acyl carrier protein